MRIQEQIIKAFQTETNFKSRLFRNHPDIHYVGKRRDKITVVGKNPLFSTLDEVYIEYEVWGTRIAAKSKNSILLGCYTWKTKLTKDRINIIARLYNLPCIVQRKGEWFWTDNVPYAGPRIFNI